MVIPVHDVNPLRRTPWVTYALVAINLVVLLLTPGSIPGAGSQAGTVCRQEAFFDHYGAIPREMIKDRPPRLVPTGRAVQTARGPACVIAKPRYHKNPVLSVLFAMFVHGGWLHLLGNMLFLVVFGNNIEDRFGRLRYLVFYLACGYVAAYGFAAANPNSVQPLVGASGAIAGVLGAYLVLYPRARVWSLVPFLFFIPLRIPAWLVLGLWFILQWGYAVGQYEHGGGAVAYLAHVFGFVAGMLVGLMARAVGSGGRPAISYRGGPGRA
jgi:membrane associated rhomboid family serine protease